MFKSSFTTGSLARHAITSFRWSQIRPLSSLESNPHIYVFPSKTNGDSNILSLLSTEPVNTDLAIGVTNKLPPTPDSVRENPKFLSILHEVFAKHAHEDPEAQSQAQVMISQSGANLYSGGVLVSSKRSTRKHVEAEDSSGGASGQGGAGGGGHGGWIHLSDRRRAPEFGRTAWPEDIFGSLEVDGNGQFVGGNGKYQASGTYRLVTRDGILGLTPFMREKLVQRLRELDQQ